MGDWFIIKYYEDTLERIQEIQQIICNNAGLPNDHAVMWDIPRQTTKGWAIQVPVNGWNGLTHDQMIVGFTQPELLESQIEFTDE